MNNVQVNDRSPKDELDERLAHLEAQIVMIYGGGYESFNAYADRIKDNYLWGLHQSVKDIRAAFERL